MPSSPPSFIRYFAQTDESELGKAALEYGKSMLRIAPLRIVSLSGGLIGAWRRYDNLLLTPMAGTYVNAVCTSPDRWVWTSSVPMTDSGVDEPWSPWDARPDWNPVPAKTEVVERVEELYTPSVRNVLFMASMPTSDQQRAAAMKYEVIISSLRVAQFMVSRWPQNRFEAGIVSTPVSDHTRIRRAIVGDE